MSLVGLRQPVHQLQYIFVIKIKMPLVIIVQIFLRNTEQFDKGNEQRIMRAVFWIVGDDLVKYLRCPRSQERYSFKKIIYLCGKEIVIDDPYYLIFLSK